MLMNENQLMNYCNSSVEKASSVIYVKELLAIPMVMEITRIFIPIV
ncbi:hypothetical protein LCGC14_0612750 [marine sediment metagenome]|uniref:Uncharacterized protein n=1 Tax=marine sediment metagenome TaxID=412755 RepID=A0A0F9TTH5_9ZZZZ